MADPTLKDVLNAVTRLERDMRDVKRDVPDVKREVADVKRDVTAHRAETAAHRRETKEGFERSIRSSSSR